MGDHGHTLILDSWSGPPAADPPLPWDVYWEDAYQRVWMDGATVGTNGPPFLPCELQARPVAFTYRQGTRLWFHLCHRRLIPASGRDDLETPYGYGGPLANCEDPGFLREADAAFVAWARQEGVVAEFIRFHPLLENWRFCSPDSWKVIYNRPTVAIDLRASKELLSARLNPGFARAARKAERSGLYFRELVPNVWIEPFRVLYEKTMRRVQAPNSYFFSLERMRGFLADHLDMRMIGVFAPNPESGPDRLAAAAMVFGGPEDLHYHLGASDPDLLDLRPNNLLFRDLLLWAAQQRRWRRLHLGGGNDARPDNSLLRFKRSLGFGEARYQIGTRIYDQAEYDRICTLAITRKPELAPLRGRFFQLYRLVDD